MHIQRWKDSLPLSLPWETSPLFLQFLCRLFPNYFPLFDEGEQPNKLQKRIYARKITCSLLESLLVAFLLYSLN